ncbi:MAG: bifunctional diguanylate cyclase/phosphodiesterase [Acidobacteriota bacterium]|nr:bifunctional diguanylate cyclase/phosphodiesterase [Acidobacteriota bacterium]
MNSKAAKIFIWGVIAAGISVCILASQNLPLNQINLQFAFFAVFTIAFGSRLSLQMPKSNIRFSMGDALIFLIFLLYGGEFAILLAAAEAFVTSLMIKRRMGHLSNRTIFFNVALIACSTAGTYLAFLLYQKAAGGKPNFNNLQEFASLIGLMAISQFFFNSVLAAIYQAFKASLSVWQAWNEKCLVGSVTYFIGAALAGVMYQLIEYSNLFTLIIAAIIVALIYVTYRRYIKELEKTIEQAEQAERQKAEIERLRAEEAEKHVAALSASVAEQKRISEALRTSKERFRHAALHDALTDLPNRSFFTEQLKYLLDNARIDPSKGFCVLFIDLDRFKNINDSLGHAVGDELLILVGKRIERIIRQGDIVSRLGGDEFAIVLVNITSPEDAVKFAERIYESISQPFQLHGFQVYTAPSIGIAMSNAEYEQPDDILRDSDIAMYHAKERGGGCAMFNQELRNRAVSVMKIESELRHVVEREELRVFYQPIISLESGRLAGFEALMRWQHPERGLVSPAEFIPVAEDTGLIVPMTIWILREACTQLSRWRWQSPINRSLLVSVNLSGKHFTEPNLVEQVSQILQETGLEPYCLKLEITESAAMENAEATAKMLSNLRKLGVRLSIDDFGTGYSSLSYLHRFPIDTLKIDRSFVSRMGESGENSEIVQTIVTLAKNLEMDVIAEGVETAHQVVLLRDFGCRYAQGFLFSKPQPAADIEKLMKQKSNWLPEEIEVIQQSSPNNIIQLR